MSKYEFVKLGNNYLVKNSGGRIVSEKEKLQMENKELVLKDLESCECQKETTKKISKNKKRIEEIEKENKEFKTWLELTPEINETVLEKEESTDDIIKETD